MPAGGKPTVRSRRFGRKMQRHRVKAGFDQAQAAVFIYGSRSKISRMEDGITTAKPAEVLLLLDRYGVHDETEREHLVWLAKNSNHRGWWLEHAEHLRPDYLDHIALEDDATYIREWQPVLFPGLLQTPAYAEAIITTGPNYVAPERVTHLVKAREGRQAKIDEGGTAYAAILWEAVIVHPLVSIEIHREQLSAILEVGKRRHVTVQVLPFTAGAAGATSAFSSFSFDSEPTVEAVTLENLRGTSVLEGTEDLAAYANAFDLLRSSALTPEASVRLIRRVLRSSKEDAS
ncbi:helix-turn-helix domain-containing protein [Streptomyces sp. NBC_01340]|uniref:helix-turn-helix domain-containing protein n=1 Tax=unclassified Streptomyces TaxID=2593676 RepID=UPI00225628F1|nr:MULTISPECIES: helix-turn-helix transcriptional regulator [unclassified Streptomyces]MCX4454950.1 helix-turn-helix domain-containing protein [Streptomyces sp. NBC_01719]MCX4494310.1 helix-turn-helix domain-containing protein [Streptomyces sp. NBC_01728]WSI39360.1 helix-turn-helix domain-containing protein [Streptomyces sp. NBC_01340]